VAGKTKSSSPNFAFLAQHDELLVRLAEFAERYVFDDPNSALIKIRQLAEALAQRAAANVGIQVTSRDNFSEVLGLLRSKNVLVGDVLDVSHRIRKTGNDATHDFVGEQREALVHLQLVRRLAIWFHRTFSNDRDFKAGAFIPPPDPAHARKDLLSELDFLRAEVARQQLEASEAKQTAAQEAARREAADAHAAKAYEDLAAALELAGEVEQKLEQQKVLFQQQTVVALAAANDKPATAIEAIVDHAQQEGQDLALSEPETRRIIDAQLREAGWEADSETLSYANGTRPVKARNLAIAEWPTETGPADYALFSGLTCIGVVEAKRKNKDCSSAIEQAKRYSRGMQHASLPDMSPWGKYRVPFLFSTNGRPYLKQLETKSGIWFLDARVATNHPRALAGWRSPDELVKDLALDVPAANRRLTEEPKDYLPLRPYQVDAVDACEKAIASDQRAMLVAMATGTGKTITCISLIYRLLKARRFRRILFLVDRTSLGEQTMAAFKTERLEQARTFTEIYDVKGLGDQTVERDTKLHIATVQSLVRRVFDDDDTLPVDLYDCIVVDECHRGYTLDREMSDSELEFRNEEDYISKFRRVIEHFDAVKIGLTATPALHTVEIFGEPVYSYDYRRAVVEGYLIDHEPPVQIVTELGKNGIHFARGEQMEIFRTKPATIDLVHAPDDVDLEIDSFNERVITENFNRAICSELVHWIDPAFPGKTLIFCARDDHADLVVKLLKEAYEANEIAVDDDAIRKLTGASDKPSELIRRFRNETDPKIAVTVDLLTTGIDVPSITNIVFIRRVRSRILYEQMMGRATRLCRDLYGQGQDKEVFRIFDCVRLYEEMQNFTAMKPVVQNVNTTFATLVDHLQKTTAKADLDAVFTELRGRLQRRGRRMSNRHRSDFEVIAKMTYGEFLGKLRAWTPKQAQEFFRANPAVVALLDVREETQGERLIVSHHGDAVLEVSRGYGDGKKPETYIAGFAAYLKANLNEIPALLTVIQRPRDLTRKELREIKLVLDHEGFGERALQSAFRDATNQDIAASIIGFIRQAALGSPLQPYDQRVARAITKILGKRQWTQVQRQWIDRLGKQLKKEVVLDREALDMPPFDTDGGYNRINKVFDGRLELLLDEIEDEIWSETA
jgi:type I restriction enzyme R subunit